MTSTDTQKPSATRVAIVGGGIAGLFCAFILKRRGFRISLFEASDRLGGRIRTVQLDREARELQPSSAATQPEFYAEFGPMRLELDKQQLLEALLSRLGIERLGTAQCPDEAHLVDFPAYSSPSSEHDPRYELRPEEDGKQPLELLRIALLRVVVGLDFPHQAQAAETTVTDFKDARSALVAQVALAAAYRKPVDPVFMEWMRRSLTSEMLWSIQMSGRIQGVPLCEMGFWNLLSDHLSHDAVMKLKDLGTFYHLIPENPNAAEWFVWWLQNFSASEKLQGVFPGMEKIIDLLVKEAGLSEKQDYFLNAGVKRVCRQDDGLLSLEFGTQFAPHHGFHHVILALPKGPIQRIQRQSVVMREWDEDVERLLESAFGFSMVKVFVVVKKRWWTEDAVANLHATRLPTRELHYRSARTKGNPQGLVLIYTDRPASAFWANYLPAGGQDDLHSPTNPLPDDGTRLKRKVTQLLNEIDGVELADDDILWFGIRDWGRSPYDGANHAWRPERKYWIVMRRLSRIGPNDVGAPAIHVCGEAYSDWHGFIEGSLRSAVYALHRIFAGAAEDTGAWLKSAIGIELDDEYRESIESWVASLDSIQGRPGFET